MISNYSFNDEVSTLRIWFDNKPFSKEIQENIKNLKIDLISEEAKQMYINERLEKEEKEKETVQALWRIYSHFLVKYIIYFFGFLNNFIYLCIVIKDYLMCNKI